MPEVQFDFPYSNLELTQEVNRLPNTFGYMHALDIAPSEAKRSSFVRVEFRDGEFFVLGAEERGSRGQTGKKPKQNGVILEIPHFPYLEVIRPDDINGLLEVVNGQVTEASLANELVRVNKIFNLTHGVTREFLRCGMLKGVIYDGYGEELYDLYDLFGQQQKTVNFALNNANTNVLDKCEEVSGHIEDNLKGETSTGVNVPVDAEFFSKLIAHDNVEKYWLNARNDSEHKELKRQLVGERPCRVFEFGVCRFIEMRGTLPFRDADGKIVTQKYIEANTGYAYPSGTQNMMRTFDGPVHHINEVNKAPEIDVANDSAIYISAEPLDHGEGIELKSQSNTIAINKQPNAVVKITAQ